MNEGGGCDLWGEYAVSRFATSWDQKVGMSAFNSGDLVAWAVQKHMRVELPTIDTVPPWPGDVNVKEHLEKFWRPAKIGCPVQEHRQMKSDILQRLEELRVTWLSDMTV